MSYYLHTHTHTHYKYLFTCNKKNWKKEVRFLDFKSFFFHLRTGRSHHYMKRLKLYRNLQNQQIKLGQLTNKRHSSGSRGRELRLRIIKHPHFWLTPELHTNVWGILQAPQLRLAEFRAGKMAFRMGRFATKPDNPSLVLRSQMVEGENADSHRLSSDLYSYELSLCEHACIHTHTI